MGEYIISPLLEIHFGQALCPQRNEDILLELAAAHRRPS